MSNPDNFIFLKDMSKIHLYSDKETLFTGPYVSDSVYRLHPKSKNSLTVLTKGVVDMVKLLGRSLHIPQIKKVYEWS